MAAAEELVDEALAQAGGLPSNRTFRTWCNAYRAGHADEYAGKRAFRSVWADLGDRRFGDFTQLLASAEARMAALGPEQIIGWAQATATRAALELAESRALQSPEAAMAQRMKASDLAAAALRFVRFATSRGIRLALADPYSSDRL